MPAVSKAQYRLMQAAAHGKSDKVSESVGREFVAATPHPGKLPEKQEKAKPRRKRSLFGHS